MVNGEGTEKRESVTETEREKREEKREREG